MGPGQFVTQCVTNSGRPGRTPACGGGWTRSIALAELRLEPLGEPFEDPLAVVGPLLPACSSSTMTRPTSQ